MTMTDTQTSKEEFVISRVINAPRERVFDAFTNPDQMRQWFSPKGFTVIAAKMDLRPGGFYHYGMRGPDGNEMWGKSVYREIKRPERIVYVNSFSDEAGNITRHPMSPTWPRQLLTTILFEEQKKGQTKLTIKWALLEPNEEERATFMGAHDGMRQGWTGSLDKLTDFIAKA